MLNIVALMPLNLYMYISLLAKQSSLQNFAYVKSPKNKKKQNILTP